MRCRGVALVLVLWLMVLMIGLIGVFALSSRTESLQGHLLASGTQARYQAEAGIELAAAKMAHIEPELRWVPDDRVQRLRFEDADLAIRVLDESGKVDLNVAGPDVLLGLMQALGIQDLQARALVGAIQDWRDEDDLLMPEGGAEDPQYAAAGRPYGAKDRPFETVGELQQVLGMDAAIYGKLAPHVTVMTGLARPNPAFATEPVLRALGWTDAQIGQWLAQRKAWRPGLPPPIMPDGTPLAVSGTGTYSISSLATRPDGTTVEVTATVRIGASGAFGRLYAPLAWRVGDPD